MTVLENVPLAPYTTLGVGGPARWLVEAASEDDLLTAVRFARAQGVPFFILGGGSNLLVSDSGFPGVVIHVAATGSVWTEESNGFASIVSNAGANWDSVVQLAVEKNCAGIECLAGIPGSVGGTPVQNIGAYGQEVAETIVRVRAYDLTDSAFVELDRESCGFGYRRSIFNSTAQGRYIVTAVSYRLRVGGAPTLKYADLGRYFAERLAAGETRKTPAAPAPSSRTPSSLLQPSHASPSSPAAVSTRSPNSRLAPGLHPPTNWSSSPPPG